MTSTFIINTEISIALGGAVAHSAVFSRMAHVMVVNATAKAVQVKGDNGQTCWLPKSALVVKGEYFKLAGWFKMDSYQWRFFERNQSIGGVSNA
jgi:hypothetical protein